MSRKLLSDNFDQEVIHTVERQVLPAWEHYGVERLAVSQGTLQEFAVQPLPADVRYWEKPRQSVKSTRQRKVVRSTNVIEEWPADDQINTRFPILIFVRSGEAEMQLGDYVASCPAGHFLFLTPGVAHPAGREPHLEKAREGKECELWWFHTISSQGLVALSVCYSIGNRHINSGQYYVVSDEHIMHLFRLFSEEVIERPAQYEEVVKTTLQTFFQLFLRAIKEKRFINRGTNDISPTVPLSTSPIDLARQYIESNLNRPLTIDSVAQAVFMSKTKFTQQFHQETGQTFREYLIERRLEEAKRWLEREDYGVEVVCRYVGLKKSRLHELFQEHYGMTPMEYRSSVKMSKTGV